MGLHSVYDIHSHSARCTSYSDTIRHHPTTDLPERSHSSPCALAAPPGRCAHPLRRRAPGAAAHARVGRSQVLLLATAAARRRSSSRERALLRAPQLVSDHASRTRVVLHDVHAAPGARSSSARRYAVEVRSVAHHDEEAHTLGVRDESVGSRRATEGELIHSGHSHLTAARRSEQWRRTYGHVQLML